MVKIKKKKWPPALYVRVLLVFFLAFGIMVFAAYYVLSQNFQELLTDYTVKLVQSIVDQGVTSIEYELRINQEEVMGAADRFVPHDIEVPETVSPDDFPGKGVLHMYYTPVDGVQDKTAAFKGPYFNEENEYLIGYSAPVSMDGNVVGMLTIEKDGYHFSELISSIKFVDTGESYIIDAEGTDIAVSDPEHMDWVKSRYNARSILAEKEDPVTRAIFELEQKGLNGETGVGTYSWEGNLYYVIYAPVPSCGWVLLAGLRDEELQAMTRSTLYASLADGPVLPTCILIFLLLTLTIIAWIYLSMKKTREINQRLEVIANFDFLTGLMNRNSYHMTLESFSTEHLQSLACVYIDANGLHEINNHLGHQAGDKMLTTVALELKHAFLKSSIYRIGGDEFVILCRNMAKDEVLQKMGLVCRKLKSMNYDISFGIEWRDHGMEINEVVSMAEAAMQNDKKQYYQAHGKERQTRELDMQLEQLLMEKQDADTFLSVLAPEFKGVYFVNLGSDTIRHLYIPPYFEDMLKESGYKFSKALSLYACRIVAPEYRKPFEKFCCFTYIEAHLRKDAMPEFVYQREDKSWMKLRVLKFKAYTEQSQETLWIFSSLEN